MKRRVFPIIVFGVLIAGAATYFLLRKRGEEAGVIAASGTVEATQADLGFPVAGRIDVLEVREGDTTSAGKLLARLDQSEVTARRAHAMANLSSARAALTELKRGSRPPEIAQARAAAEGARKSMEETERQLARTRTLEEGGAASRQSLERAQTAYEVARAQYEQAGEQQRLVELGPRIERIQVQEGIVKQAQSAVEQIDAVIRNSSILAPFAGLVTVRHRVLGETVQPGAPVFTIMDPLDRWVRIYVPEREIGKVALGQSAEIRTDTYPDVVYAGRVMFIAEEAEFTPRNVQTAEERVKLVYAVKVFIAGDSTRMLKPGMPADVRLLVPFE